MRNVLLSTSVLPLAVVPFVAAAQVSDTAPIRLEEVMVTSQRYQSPLQEVPISVHVVSGEYIEKARIVNLVDLSQSVPNVVIGEGAINTHIYMRGVGSGTNRAFEQSVGMYIDEIYMGRGSQYRQPFLDLQQVDVLRGPQGALFGKNTIAGAMVLSTRKPDLNETFGATFIADYEPQYNGRSLTSTVSGAFNSEWAMRFVNKTASHDGYWTNTFTGRDEPRIDESINRLSILYQPYDNWRFDAKWEHSEFDAAGSTVQVSQLEPLTPIAKLLIDQAYRDDPALDTKLNSTRSVDNLGLPEYRNQENDNGLFSAKYEGAVDVTYTLGYSAFETEESQDLDYLPISFIGVDDETDFEQWSQELRIDQELSRNSRLQWGFYWQDQTLDANFQENIALPPLGGLWHYLFALNGIDPAVYPPTPLTRNTAFSQSSETRAVFAEWQWQFADKWRLFLGGRYNQERKEYRRQSSQDEFLNPGVPASAPANVTAMFFDVNVLTPQFEDSRKEDDFLPSVKLWWNASESTNTYAKIERGAKSGGFNAVADSAPGDQTYDDEQAISYEIGTKSLFFNDRVSLNSAFFYTEIEDLQMTVLNGSRFLVGNAAQSVSQGVEVDGSWRIDDHWQVSAYGAFLDAFYDDYQNGPCTLIETVGGATTCDLTGETTPFSPKWNAGLQLDYEVGLTQGIDFVAGLQISYSDEYSLNADLDVLDTQPSYSKFDGQLGLRASAWELTFIGKNLTDETIANYSLDTPLIPGGHAAYLSAPRSAAIRFKLNI